VDRAERRAREALGDSSFDAAFVAGAADPDQEITRGRQRVVSA
jgi:hypothetical protein